MKTLLDYCIDEDEHSLSVMGKFLLWLLLGLIVTFIGISNVFADTYNYSQFTGQLYDNYGPNLSAVTTDPTNGRWQGTIPTMTANSAGAAWGVSSPVVLLSSHTYSVTLKITGSYGGNIVLSSYNRVGVGTTLANAKTSYQNNSNATENYSRVVDGQTIQYAFTPTINASYFIIPFATSSSGSNYTFYLENVVIDDLGSSGGVSESTINNSLNSQTNVLNQSITNSQNAIIQNQNENNEALQDTINDNFQNCENRNLISNFFNYNVLSNYFTITNRSSDILFQAPSNVPSGIFTIGYSVILEKDKTYTLHSEFINNRNLTFNWYVYQTNWSSGLLTYGMDANGNLSITPIQTGTHYIQLYSMTSMSTGWDWALTKFEINIRDCTNRLDEQTDAINGVNDTLNDNSIDTSDATSFFDNFTDNTHGLSGIISAPLNAINSMLSNQCSPLTATWKNKTMSLPCGYDMWSRFSTFKEFLNIVLDGLLCYRILLKLFKLVERFKNPNDDRVEVMDL